MEVNEEKKQPGFSLWFRRYAPFAKFGRANPYTMGLGYFQGDNRGVSTSLQATCRTYGYVLFNRFGILHHAASASKTHFHPAWGSVVEGESKVNSTVVRSKLNGPDLFAFSASTAGSNPLIKPSPDLNTYIDVTIDFSVSNLLKIKGEAFGDNFPNLEIFVMCMRSKRTALLLDGQTTGGKSTGPATRLFFAGEHNLLAKFATALALDQKGELTASSVVSPTKLKD